MNEIWDPNLTHDQILAQRAYRKWLQRASREVAFAADMDAGFDGGEFSGPAHWRDFEDRAQRAEHQINTYYGVDPQPEVEYSKIEVDGYTFNQFEWEGDTYTVDLMQLNHLADVLGVKFILKGE